MMQTAHSLAVDIGFEFLGSVDKDLANATAGLTKQIPLSSMTNHFIWKKEFKYFIAFQDVPLPVLPGKLTFGFFYEIILMPNLKIVN